MNIAPSISRIEAGDWPAIDRIQRAAFDPEVIEETAVFASFARLSPSTCLLARINGQPVGYLLAHPWVDEDMPSLGCALEELPAEAKTLFIHDLALLPASRGSGTARALIAQAFAAGKAAGLVSASLLSVQGSQLFWEKQGFVARPDIADQIGLIVRKFTEMPFVFMSRDTLD